MNDHDDRHDRDNLARTLFFDAWDKFEETPTLVVGICELIPQYLHPLPDQPGCYKLGQKLTLDLKNLRYLEADGSRAAVIGWPDQAVIVPMIKVDGSTLEEAAEKAAQMVYSRLREGSTSVCVFLLEGMTRDQVRPFVGWESCGFTFMAYSAG